MILFSALFKLKKVQKMYLAYNSTPNPLRPFADHEWSREAANKTKNALPV